jgi:hypothetical protein
VKTALGDGKHVTSTHVLREWKHIVEGATAEVLNASRGGATDVGSVFARLSQGWGRQPGQRLRILSILLNGEAVPGPDLGLRAQQMLRYRSRVMFEHHIDELRDGSHCGLATNSVTQKADGTHTLKDTCKKTEVICRQDQLLSDLEGRWRSLAAALVEHASRQQDRKMGQLATKLANEPDQRKGKNCYGKTGDVSVALECGAETLLTTDESFEALAKGGGFAVERLSPTRPP